MKKKNLIIIGSVLLVLLIFFIVKASNSSTQKISLETAKVKKGTVSNIVTATGNIDAIKTVQVGTRVSGEVRKIYVDFNSDVKAGQLLAELDQKPLTTALTISEASLSNAKANMAFQTATYNRTKALYDKKLVAESDYDQTVYNFETAKASLKTAQLNYEQAKINLEYAFIYSPINGVVLNRAVDEGQTVAASFSTPTLFTIVNDLTRMQVEASIAEADIGQVRNNQEVEFTVDAYPGETFKGTITQIRLQPTVTSNVVNYTVIIMAPNPDKKLMPGMTANINVYVNKSTNVLVIPSKALRFNPDPELLNRYYQSLPEKERPKMDQLAEKPKSDMYKKHSNQIKNDSLNNLIKLVWKKSGNILVPVRVETGLDDDLNVEIKSGLNEGDEIVTELKTNSIKVSTANQQSNSSPFMPKFPSRNTKTK